MAKRSKKKTTVSWITIDVLFLISIFSFVIYAAFEPMIISKRIGNELFEYPLPPESEIVEKHQFNEKMWIYGGNGGYWEVAAHVKVQTSLSRDEIIRFYEKRSFVPHPKYESGINLQLYFEDDISIHEDQIGFYYRNKEGRENELAALIDSDKFSADSISDDSGKITYVV